MLILYSYLLLLLCWCLWCSHAKFADPRKPIKSTCIWGWIMTSKHLTPLDGDILLDFICVIHVKTSIWVNFNDLTATSLESWLRREIILKQLFSSADGVLCRDLEGYDFPEVSKIALKLSQPKIDIAHPCGMRNVDVLTHGPLSLEIVLSLKPMMWRWSAGWLTQSAMIVTVTSTWARRLWVLMQQSGRPLRGLVFGALVTTPRLRRSSARIPWHLLTKLLASQDVLNVISPSTSSEALFRSSRPHCPQEHLRLFRFGFPETNQPKCNCLFSLRKDFTNLYTGLGQCTNCSYHLTKRVNIISCPFFSDEVFNNSKARHLPDMYQTLFKQNHTALLCLGLGPCPVRFGFQPRPVDKSTNLTAHRQGGDANGWYPRHWSRKRYDIHGFIMIYIYIYIHHMFIVQ